MEYDKTKLPSGASFFHFAESLIGKDATEISDALIDAYFSGRQYGFQEAKELYRDYPQLLPLPEEHPVCSVCRDRHPNDDRHPCE